MLPFAFLAYLIDYREAIQILLLQVASTLSGATARHICYVARCSCRLSGQSKLDLAAVLWV
jgi:hypothetical protein